jgi:type IV pilus assembly protein PilC
MSTTYLAHSSEEAKRYFENLGYCVLSIKKDWRRIQIRFKKKIKDNDFITFNQELIALLKAGYPVHKALETIIQRIKNPYFKELLMKISENVRQGKSLSESFSPYVRIFSPIYPVSLLAGERSGNLEESITRFLTYFKTISQTKKRVKSALTYPTLLIIFSFILLGILFYFVLPRFSSFYSDFKAQLPFITRFLLSFSSFLESNILYILIGLLILLIFYFRIKRTEKGALFLDAIKLKMPYISVYWIDSNIALFSRTLSLLLASGLSLLSSVNIAQNSVFNKKLRAKMKSVPELIKNGESLTNSLEKTGFFPALSLDIIRVGETSASLPEMLTEVADFYDQKIETRVSTLVSLIEPVLIIFMGLLIASMLLSIYLPIFNLVRITR